MSNDTNINHFELLALQRHKLKVMSLSARVFERQGRRRVWHMWGIAIVLGTCILIGSDWITAALWSYCPVETEVILRPT
jgi:hypothetical protein